MLMAVLIPTAVGGGNGHGRLTVPARSETTTCRATGTLPAPAGERAIATLKTWMVLTRPRCCPHRATIVQAILVLRLNEEASAH